MSFSSITLLITELQNFFSILKDVRSTIKCAHFQHRSQDEIVRRSISSDLTSTKFDRVRGSRIVVLVSV
jgi:hypothetical protein